MFYFFTKSLKSYVVLVAFRTILCLTSEGRILNTKSSRPNPRTLKRKESPRMHYNHDNQVPTVKLLMTLFLLNDRRILDMEPGSSTNNNFLTTDGRLFPCENLHRWHKVSGTNGGVLVVHRPTCKTFSKCLSKRVPWVQNNEWRDIKFHN